MTYLVTYNILTREIVRRWNTDRLPPEWSPPKIDEDPASQPPEDFARATIEISYQELEMLAKPYQGHSFWLITADLTSFEVNPKFKSKAQMKSILDELASRIAQLETKVP